MSLETLGRLKLITGRGKHTELTRLCHAGRLVGGLSLSTRATPDEVAGPLTFAMGGAARALRILDVRSGLPMVLEVQAGELTEKWELVDVPALVHNLNDLYKEARDVKAVAVLGEWEDMLQVWCIEKSALPTLLSRRVLEAATNVQTLWSFSELAID